MRKNTKIVFLVALVCALLILLVSCHSNTVTPTTPDSTSSHNTHVSPTTSNPVTSVSPTSSGTNYHPITHLPISPFPTKVTDILATPTPSEEPEPVIIYNSGRVSSETGTYLNLVCNWSVEKIEHTDNYIFTAVLVLESYSLYCTGRNDGVFTIGDQINTNFYSPEISIDKEAGFQTTYFTAQTCVLDREQIRSGIDVFASWAFHGSYSGVELDTIAASEHITFCE